jgi:hypothetical protein
MNQRFETSKTETGVESMSSRIPTFDPVLKTVNAVHGVQCTRKTNGVINSYV